jgi:hypothetical protein
MRRHIFKPTLRRYGDRAQRNLPFALWGTNFPTQKEEVASNAESNGAPQDLVTQIRNADTERFNSPEEVMQALQSSLNRGRLG